MKRPKELRKSFFDSPETRDSKDLWALVVQVEAEKQNKGIWQDEAKELIALYEEVL